MLDHLYTKWHDQFGDQKPEVVVRAPGRINIIGEHTDYNQGWVMPGAMDLAMYVMVSRVGRHETDDKGNNKWVAADLDEMIVFALDAELPDTRTIWPKYVHGAVQFFEGALGPLHILIGGNLPIGAGVSSSSSLVGGLLLALQTISGDHRSRQELAELSGRVEKEIIGLQGGIMDQYAIMMSQKNKVMLLDCRDKTFEFLTADLPGTSWMLINTKVKHQLIDSDYNQRSAQCRQAVELIQLVDSNITSLRDVSEALLLQSNLPEVLFKRSLFVIRENERVHNMKAALTEGDAVKAGQLLQQSHLGLQYEYEVSCPEADHLASLANASEGVYGGRMMGGGFGGCVICLVANHAVSPFVKTATDSYRQRFGFEPDIIYFTLSDGAEVIT